MTNEVCLLRALKRWAELSFPTDWTVRLRGVSASEVAGCTTYERVDGEVVAVITVDQDEVAGRPNYLTWVFLHEYAHVMSSGLCYGEEHPAEFWMAFGRLYRRYYEEGGDLAVAGLLEEING